MAASSSNLERNYDVFVSFRGTDVCNGFLSHLYDGLDQSGIYTFRDSEELRKGEEISPALLKAIEYSRIAIIVFSENYASSTWCLEELATIMKCKEQRDLKVFPVFYKVEPREVRTQRVIYSQAMAKHEEKFGKDSEKVKRWRKALLDGGSLSGWEYHEGDEVEFMQRIVKELSIRLERTPLHVAQYPVGIDSRVQELISLSQKESGDDDVLMIGLWGPGGVGKTTLAKAMYNAIQRQFQGSSFLERVRETSNQSNGLASLQEKLLSEILPHSNFKVHSVDRGINLIREKLCCKKVLLVLDDVDEFVQLDALAGEDHWFGKGSRIIVTSRDKHLLNFRGINWVYEVKTLDDDEARELFHWHAFQNGMKKIRRDLIDGSLRYAEGLPLALKELGSFLRGREEPAWEHALRHLSKYPFQNINGALKTSFDGLDCNVREIFLDIACFFKGKRIGDIEKILDSCNFASTMGIEVLIERSLLRIEDGYLQMYDLVQLMGKDIVNQECLNDPAKRSRLWVFEDVMDILYGDMGTNAVEAIVLDSPEAEEITISPHAFSNMRRLRMLILSKVHISSQGPVRLPKDLRWLEWPNAPDLEFGSGPKELVGIDIHNSRIEQLGGNFTNFRNLKFINFGGCESLTSVPDLSSSPKLETLNLSDCKSLVEVHQSVGYLDKLTFLGLRGCSNLSIFPKELKTKSLQTLDLFCCSKLEKFPDIPEKMKHLEILDLQGTAIKELPTSIENLVSVKRINLENCKNLARLPPSIYKLHNLESLTLLGCLNFVMFPKSLEDSTDHDGYLGFQNLTTLDLASCNLSEVEFLESSSSFPKLRFLDLSGNKFTHIPTCINKYDDLEWLNVEECQQLQEIPQLPSNMRTLRANGCKSLQKCPDLSSLSSDCLGVEFRKGVKMADLSSVENSEKMKDEAGQTSGRNYAIAAVQNVVGIDDHAKQITDLLEMEVNDEVRILGIYGADGIGKTTLAKAVYDRISCCFDGRSFLAEVDKTAQDRCGIQILQTRLVRDILERDREDPSFHERIEDFEDMFRERKVLIVVDDVEEKSHLHDIVGDQLDRFGPGSLIIVTSQNERILEGCGAEKVRTYRVGKLDDGQAFELFCEHAFRMQSSIPDYDGLANRIVNATEKLPLAVEVVGSFLRGKSIQEWAKMEESMKARAMSSEKATVGLEEILDICYEGLNEQQKDIFLDIACFISGVDARIASCLWPSFYRPSSGCVLMPLAKIGENNELQMHRLPGCLGKRILNQEESQDPRSTRVCTQDMVLKATNRQTGMGNVEALCFDFTAGDFQSMQNVRFLKLDNAKLSGNFEGAFPRLRGLYWQRCPPEYDAENLVLGELANLDLSWSKITEDWGGWKKIKMGKLKVLNLTGCSDLLFTPDFSGYKDLKFLILEGCSRLVKLDPSIGHLRRLVSLNLRFCSRLNALPVEMGCMTALKELFIDGTSVREIPISIGNLKKLEILSGFECVPLTHLPRSICYLTALSELSFDGTEITKLPSSLGDLLKLRRLSLRNCRYLEGLPDSIGRMGSSLKELDISRTRISVLPASIGNLESLRVLRMDYSFIRAFPGEIGNLTKLEELHASWCRSLKGAIPNDIKRLHHLGSLTLGHSRISSLPTEISTIPHLHTLELIQCNEIEELPKLPPSLIHLRVSSTRMKVTPLLEDLKELEELCLSDGDPKARRPPSSKRLMPESNVIDGQSFSISFPKLRTLELSLSQVIKLQIGPTDDIPPLKMLTHAGSSSKEVSELPKMLSMFKLYDSAIEEIEGLEGLEALKRLDISNCRIRNLDGIGRLTSLRSLILSDCNCLSSLDVSKLKSLKVLEIRRCKMICEIEGLDKLTSLVKRNISECRALTTM